MLVMSVILLSVWDHNPPFSLVIHMTAARLGTTIAFRCRRFGREEEGENRVILGQIHAPIFRQLGPSEGERCIYRFAHISMLL